jgi:hypothetical protein
MKFLNSILSEIIKFEKQFYCDCDIDDVLQIIDTIENWNFAYLKNRWDHIRIQWNVHVAQLLHEEQFENTYRMSFQCWDRLTFVLEQHLLRNSSKSRCSEPITIQLIMGIGMMFLAGGSINQTRHIFGLSRSEAYRCVNHFIDAILLSPVLDIKLPRTDEEWNNIKHGFMLKSSLPAMEGCVGAVDGFFQKTTAPIVKEVGNVISYFSGHYQSYGLNCQAACDANLKFMYFGVVATGSTNDNIAIHMADDLIKCINELPLGMFFVGDAAYTLSENLLIPFTGSQRNNLDNDAFNYYLSQLRIRIEMAFGRLVNKFRVLKKHLEGSLKRKSRIIMTCARLHNFIIDMDNDISFNCQQIGKHENRNTDTEDQQSTDIFPSLNKNDQSSDIIDNDMQCHINIDVPELTSSYISANTSTNNTASNSSDISQQMNNSTTGDMQRTLNNDINVVNLNTMDGTPLGMCYNPTVQEPFFEKIEGVSNTRRRIVDYIRTHSIRRPEHNRTRNDYENNQDLPVEYYHPT